MKNPQYITQIDKEWLGQVDAAVNVRGGSMIKVEKKNDETVIKIDEDAFKIALWYFIHNAITIPSPGGWRCNFDQLMSVRTDQET